MPYLKYLHSNLFDLAIYNLSNIVWVFLTPNLRQEYP